MEDICKVGEKLMATTLTNKRMNRPKTYKVTIVRHVHAMNKKEALNNAVDGIRQTQEKIKGEVESEGNQKAKDRIFAIQELNEGDKYLTIIWNEAITQCMVNLPFNDKETRERVSKLYKP